MKAIKKLKACLCCSTENKYDVFAGE